MKKGITPIVAIIMLLLIVVSIVGGVFIWMRGTFGDLQNVVGNQTQQQAEEMGQEILIQSVDCGSETVYVQNTGSSNIDSASVFAAGSPCNTDVSMEVGNTTGFDCSGEDLSGTITATTESGANDETTGDC